MSVARDNAEHSEAIISKWNDIAPFFLHSALSQVRESALAKGKTLTDSQYQQRVCVHTSMHLVASLQTRKRRGLFRCG